MVIRAVVTIHGFPEKFLIVSNEGEESIGWLCERAVERCHEQHRDIQFPNSFVARRSTDRSLLSLNDRIVDVLQDNDSIQIGKKKSQRGKFEIFSQFSFYSSYRSTLICICLIRLDASRQFDNDDSLSIAMSV